ncbi:MAG: hypothetical protein V7704_08240 [Aurantimonas endophytica]|uniref:hypothetical protein n=1 Tax=Aurantimonas endophytica TaxID=1522175 RepID=UPI003002AF93
MTISSTSVLLDYCSFYITGVDGVRVPVDHDGDGVTANDDCINVTASPWNEGETAITLGASTELGPKDELPRFDGLLNTPLHCLVLFDANLPKILSIDVPGERTRVRIWTNRPLCPDQVIIAVG